jgi:DNA-binding NarL/FixJ family response regulator
LKIIDMKEIVMKKRNHEPRARVLVVDDHPQVRRGVRCLVETDPDIAVCGESEGGVDALKKVVALEPDVATLDLDLGADSGLDLIQLMRALRPALKIVVLSMQGHPWYRKRAATTGADTFVGKNEATRRLVPAIRDLMLARSPDDDRHGILRTRTANRNQTPRKQHMKQPLSLLCAAAAVMVMCGLSAAHRAGAQTYSTAPTWSPMTMLNISFDTNSNKLSVVSEATKLGAGVYPALVFNTKANGSADTTNTTPANFDPSKPWSVLNGTVFSRRLGWYDPVSTSATNVLSQVQAVYGSGASVWISCLSKSDGLESYLAVGKFDVNSLGTTNADGTPVIDVTANGYSGIFGTAGSSTNWQWDGQMDHNVYAVALSNLVSSNQLFSATYKIYIGDSSGNELPAATGASTTTTWTWQGPAWSTLVTATITAIWHEPMTAPCDSVFVGSFSYNTTTHAVTDLKGVLSESMMGSVGYDATTGPNGTDDMNWLSLNHQLANGDSAHTFTRHDSTLGGTLATVFLNENSDTFATNYSGHTGDGWSPASGIDVGLRYYGYPTSASNPHNAYALIFVPDDLSTTNAISLVWNEAADTGSLGLAYTAYADYTTGGMMGSVGMSGTSAHAYGSTGSMDGAPLSEVITVVTPPSLLVGLSNGVLQLTWPTNCTGAWRLQAQTNTATAGLGTNWVNVPHCAGTNQISLPVDPGNQAVFFRLVHP